MPESGSERSEPESYRYSQWQRIKNLFQQALSVGPTERDAWLRNACSGDESLLEDVRRLLSCHETGDAFLAPPAVEPPSPTLSAGNLLAGRFRIVRLIGIGGMGEVYEAEDITAEERIALKCLRSDLADDASLVNRFRRELQLARHIAHPNICRVSEFFKSADESGRVITFFTMELLQGETLAHRISARGRLTPAESLAIIRQVAAGLAEVHQLGIIHRDLKPGNIMLMADDPRGERAVVMDFGLARAIRPGAATETRTGAIMGTPVYMAPEQFTGGSVTTACDIYALGVTIFEMLTGRTHPLTSLRVAAPDADPEWEEVVLHCVDPEPASRPESALAVVRELETRGKSIRRRRIRKIGVWCGVAACLIAAYAAVSRRPRADSHTAPMITRVTQDDGFTTDVSVSQDGKLLVYASDRGDRGDLNIWLQRTDTGSATQLTNDPEDEDEPAISADGKWIAYRGRAGQALFVKAVAGGPARQIARWANLPAFSPDGSQIAYWSGQESERDAPSGRIWRVAVAGGDPVRMAPDFLDARHPAWSPDGRRILFRGSRSDVPSLQANSDWWVMDAAGGTTIPTGAGAIIRAAGLAVQGSPLCWDGTSVVFSATLGDTTNLWRLNLSEREMRASGQPIRLTTSTDRELGPALFSDGRVAFSNWNFTSHVWRVLIARREISRVTEGILTDSQPSVSRDGRFLVFWRRKGEQRDIILRDLKRQSDLSLTTQPAAPYISPDGRDVAYSVANAVYLQATGDAKPALVCRDCGRVIGRTPDGKGALVRTGSWRSNPGIDWLDLGGGGQQRMLSAVGVTDAALSPNGAVLAFSLRKDGDTSRIFVARMAGRTASGEPIPVTEADSWADNPIWSQDGRQIFFASLRDGFDCIWRQEIDPATLTPAGEPDAVYHFHRAKFSPLPIDRSSFRLSVSQDSIYLNVATVNSNVWLLKP